MELYNETLGLLRALLPETPSRQARFSETLKAPAGEKDAVLFRSDTAYELGGSGKRSASAVLFGDVRQSETLLYGPDLSEITGDCAFAHFTVVRLCPEAAGNPEAELLKAVGFTVFQLYPQGYHIRISPVSCKEQVRVATEALRQSEPLSFLNVGSSLIGAFLAHPAVEAVQTLFITDPALDYAALAALAAKTKKITDAVHSALQLDALNCGACAMKPICDEVEGLRELHFRKEGKL